MKPQPGETGRVWSHQEWLPTKENPMCRRVTCRTCNKPTYAGCGQHVDQVLAGVPAKARCTCPKPRGLVARLLGR